METIQQIRSHYLAGGSSMLARRLTPLAGNATATTGFIPCDVFSRLAGTCYADQAGTLKIHFSGDGVNIDYTRTIPIAAADVANSAWDQLIPGVGFVKFEYVNGAAAQGAFRFYAHGKAVS